MQVAAGTRLEQYEIIAPLGTEAMGEVYRALDTKLRREVASHRTALSNLQQKWKN